MDPQTEIDSYLIKDIKTPNSGELRRLSTFLIDKKDKSPGEYYLLSMHFLSCFRFQEYLENIEISEKMGCKIAYIHKRVFYVSVNNTEKLKAGGWMYSRIVNAREDENFNKRKSLIPTYLEDLNNLIENLDDLSDYGKDILASFYVDNMGKYDISVKLRLSIKDKSSFSHVYWNLYADFTYLGDKEKAFIYLVKAAKKYKEDKNKWDLKTALDIINNEYTLNENSPVNISFEPDRFTVSKVSCILPEFLSYNYNLLDIVLGYM